MPEPQLYALSRRLKEAGREGQGLRRALVKETTDAVKPLAEKVGDLENLKEHLPDQYAEVLHADLSVRIQRFLSGDPRIEVRAKARDHRRKVKLFDQGFINHPKWPDHRPRSEWTWQNRQTSGMKAGFFSDPCEHAAPEIRERVMRALTETAKRLAP